MRDDIHIGDLVLVRTMPRLGMTHFVAFGDQGTPAKGGDIAVVIDNKLSEAGDELATIICDDTRTLIDIRRLRLLLPFPGNRVKHSPTSPQNKAELLEAAFERCFQNE